MDTEWQARVKGILKSELARTLESAGVTPAVARSAHELLGRCDELRFAGEALDLGTFAREVRETCQRISQSKPRQAEAA